jgi:hypothetical protein
LELDSILALNDPLRMTPLPRDAEDDNENEIPISEISEIFGAGTPLDRTIDKIGMGAFPPTHYSTV